MARRKAGSHGSAWSQCGQAGEPEGRKPWQKVQVSMRACLARRRPKWGCTHFYAPSAQLASQLYTNAVTSLSRNRPAATRSSALGTQHSAPGSQRSAVSTRHPALGTLSTLLGTRHSALGAATTQHSAPGSQRSAVSTRHPALGARHPALGTRQSALGSQHSALGQSASRGRTCECDAPCPLHFATTHFSEQRAWRRFSSEIACQNGHYQAIE